MIFHNTNILAFLTTTVQLSSASRLIEVKDMEVTSIAGLIDYVLPQRTFSPVSHSTSVTSVCLTASFSFSPKHCREVQTTMNTEVLSNAVYLTKSHNYYSPFLLLCFWSMIPVNTRGYSCERKKTYTHHEHVCHAFKWFNRISIHPKNLVRNSFVVSWHQHWLKAKHIGSNYAYAHSDC